MSASVRNARCRSGACVVGWLRSVESHPDKDPSRRVANRVLCSCFPFPRHIRFVAKAPPGANENSPAGTAGLYPDIDESGQGRLRFSESILDPAKSYALSALAEPMAESQQLRAVLSHKPKRTMSAP